jgi:hypothetical protein
MNAKIHKAAMGAVDARSNLYVLRTPFTHGGHVVYTDLDNWVIAPDTDNLPDRCAINPKMLAINPAASIAGEPRDADDFPARPMLTDPVTATLPDTTTLERVAKYVATNTTRGCLCGVHVAPNLCEATDAHFMLQVQGTYVVPPEGIILPVKAVKLLSAMAKAQKAEPAYDVSETYLRATWPDGTTIITKMVAGPYPNTKPIIPTDDFSAVVPLPTAELQGAIKRLLPYYEMAADANGIKKPKRGYVGIITPDGISVQHGEKRYFAPVETGVVFTYAVNMKRLSTVLSDMPAGAVWNHPRTAISAITFTQWAYLGLIMPLRTFREEGNPESGNITQADLDALEKIII